MPTRPTLTTYLQMSQPPTLRLAPPEAGVWVARAWRPTVAIYRRWYSCVGRPHHWVDRLAMPAAELQAILDDDRVEVWLLRCDQGLLGYGELDRREEPSIELAYFGLVPQAIGKGFGKFFLNWIVYRAWSYSPERLWVHTCDLDHPAALPTYQRAGFQVFDRQVVDQWLPESIDL